MGLKADTYLLNVVKMGRTRPQAGTRSLPLCPGEVSIKGELSMRKRTKLFVLVLAAFVALVVTAGALATIGALTYDKTAHLTVSKTNATVTGLIQCDVVPDVQASIFVNIIQGKGRQLVIASGQTTVLCTGQVEQWTVVVSTSQGQTFSSGSASVFVSASTFDDNKSVAGPIQLSNK
jgi:hypothetical protein